MRQVLLAAALIASTTSIALAADPVLEEPVPVAVDEGFSWTGPYIGAHIGYGFGETDADLTLGGVPIAGTEEDYDIDGLFGGVQAGYNYQINQLVLGVETDFSLADINGDSDGFGGAGAAASFFDTNVDWFGTVRGRVGFAVDRTMIYGTGGFAYGRVENTFTSPAAIVSEDDTQTGWTAGAGVEHAFTDNLTAKIEYLFVDLNDESLSVGPGLSADFDNSFHTVKLGFNYKF